MATLRAVPGSSPTPSAGHLACPYCGSYDVARLYIASIHMDSCECATCGVRWDEDTESGAYRGRADRSSVLMPRPED